MTIREEAIEGRLQVWKSRKWRGQSSRMGQLALGGHWVLVVVRVVGLRLQVKWVSVRDWKEVTVAVEKVLKVLVGSVTVTVVLTMLVGVSEVGGGGQVVTVNSVVTVVLSVTSNVEVVVPVVVVVVRMAIVMIVSTVVNEVIVLTIVVSIVVVIVLEEKEVSVKVKVVEVVTVTVEINVTWAAMVVVATSDIVEVEVDEVVI